MSRFAAVASLIADTAEMANRQRALGDLAVAQDDPPGCWRGWFDGAIKQQRDKGIGYWTLSPEGTVAEGHQRTGVGTSNQAEYEGLICCLKLLARLGARRIVVRGDSQLIINQTLGKWAVKEPSLQRFVDKARQLLLGFESVALVWVPRELNTHADILSNKPFIGYVRDPKT